MPYEFVDEEKPQTAPTGRYEFVDETPTDAAPSPSKLDAFPAEPKPKQTGALGVGATWPVLPADRSAAFNDPNKDASFMRDVVGQTAKDIGKAAVNFIPSAVNIPVNMGKAAVSGWGDLLTKSGDVARSVADVGGWESLKNVGRTVMGAIVDPIKDRYGSAEAMRKTAITDPAGMLLDESAAMGGAGAILGKGAKMAGGASVRGIEGMGTLDATKALFNKDTNSIAPVADRAAEVASVLSGGAKATATAPVKGAAKLVSEIPQSVERGLVDSAAKFPSSKKWIQGKDPVKTSVIDEAIKQGLYPTEKGVNQSAQLLEETGNKYNTIFKKGDTVNMDTALNDARQAGYRAAKGAGAPDSAAVVNAMKEVDDLVSSIKGASSDIPTDIAHDIKMNMQRQTKYDRYTPGVEESFNKALAAGLNKELKAKYPGQDGYGALNQEYRVRQKMNEGLTSAKERIQKHDPVGISDYLSIGAGGAFGFGVGGPGGASAGAMAGLAAKKALLSPNSRVAAGIGLNRLRKGAAALNNRLNFSKTEWPKAPIPPDTSGPLPPRLALPAPVPPPKTPPLRIGQETGFQMQGAPYSPASAVGTELPAPDIRPGLPAPEWPKLIQGPDGTYRLLPAPPTGFQMVNPPAPNWPKLGPLYKGMGKRPFEPTPATQAGTMPVDPWPKVQTPETVTIVKPDKLPVDRSIGKDYNGNIISWLRDKGGLNRQKWQELGLGGEAELFSNKETGSTGLSTKNGMGPDTAVEQAIQDGFLPEGSTPADFHNLAISQQKAVKDGKFDLKRDKGGYFDDAQEVAAAELKPGQTVETTMDTYKVQGYDKNGQMVLKDGVAIKLDPWEQIQGIIKTPRKKKK